MSLLIDKSIICDNYTSSNFECAECGNSLDDCDCLWDADVYDVDVFCDACDRTHYHIDVDELLRYEYESYNGKDVEDEFASIADTYSERYSYYAKCRHYNHVVEFRDGVSVYASSNFKRKDHETPPDFGLYLDSIWHPSCVSYFIDWPDYGIPTRPEVAAYTIIDTYQKAMKGLWVEVGCIGGHGRTGTVLACMAVLSGLSALNAIDYVRDQYCEHAIEGSVQKWYVEWFDAFVNGGIAPSRESYDYDTKTTIVHPEIKFPVALNWEQFDILQNPRQHPQVEDMWIEEEEYVAVTTKNEKGKSVTEYTYPDSPEWEKALEKAREQEKTETIVFNDDDFLDYEDYEDDENDLSVALIEDHKAREEF